MWNSCMYKALIWKSLQCFRYCSHREPQLVLKEKCQSFRVSPGEFFCCQAGKQFIVQQSFLARENEGIQRKSWTRHSRSIFIQVSDLEILQFYGRNAKLEVPLSELRELGMEWRDSLMSGVVACFESCDSTQLNSSTLPLWWAQSVFEAIPVDLETSGGAMRPCREVLKAPKVREDLPARTEVQVSQEPADRKVIQERHGFRGNLVGDFLHSNLGPPQKMSQVGILKESQWELLHWNFHSHFLWFAFLSCCYPDVLRSPGWEGTTRWARSNARYDTW